MNAIAPLLLGARALIILVLGADRLVLTFRGNKLHPRDSVLRQRLLEVSPVISRGTTMWRGWAGPNASHGFGAILFGLVCAYLALAHGELLFGSPLFLLLDLAALCGYAFLGWRYWFRVPLRGIV